MRFIALVLFLIFSYNISFATNKWTSINEVQIISLGVQDTTLYEQLDEFPSFPGGLQQWRKFLAQELDVDYIVSEMDSLSYAKYGHKQQAVLSFVVSENGSIRDLKIVNKNRVAPAFATAIMSMMKKSPPWIPARVNGTPVNGKVNQPIYLVLD